MIKRDFIQELKVCKERLAKERDALRDIVQDAEDVLSSFDDGIDQIEQALDTLSQYL